MSNQLSQTPPPEKTPIAKAKEHSRSIAHNTIGDIFGEQVSKWIPAVLSWVAWGLAAVNGQPLWVIFLLGVIVFTLASAGLFFIGEWRRRRLGEHGESQEAIIATPLPELPVPTAEQIPAVDAEKLKEAHNLEIVSLKKQHGEALRKLKGDKQSEIDGLKRERERLHTAHAKELDEKINQLNTYFYNEVLPEEKNKLSAQHQSEIEALREQLNDLSFSIDQQAEEIEGRKRAFADLKRDNEVLKERLEAWERYAWLRDMAEAQAKEIDKHVIVESILICDINLRDPIKIPYVEFWLNIINTSVYDITIHKDAMGGRIKFRLNNLLEGKEITSLEGSIPPSRRGHINITQRLNTTEVGLLAPYENKKEEALPFFNFDDLKITISGGTQFPQVERTSLTIPQTTGSQDTAQRTAEPTLKIEILEAMYRGYVSQSEGILGMIANINVRLTNLRRTRIDVKSFRLRVMLHGTTYVSDAAQGEIHEGRFKDKKAEIKPAGQRLQNLNSNSDFPVGIEPEQPVGGWLQFSVDGQYASDDDATPSATLTIVDTLGEEHSEKCKLTYKR